MLERSHCTPSPAFLRLPIVALLLAVTAPLAAQVVTPSATDLQRSEEAARLTDGALLDPGRAAVALMTPGGEVETVDVESGQILWLSADAAKPLGYYGDYLVAQRESETLEVVFLESTSGAVADELSIALPPGTSARIDDSVDRRFEPSLRLVGSSPVVSWTETEMYSRGVPPAPGQPLAISSSRAHRIDVATMSSAEVPVVAAQRSRQLPQTVSAWLGSTPSSNAPRIVGSVAVAAFHGAGRRDVSLRTWDLGSGQAIAETVVHRGDFTVFETSVDGRHVAVVEETQAGRYQWSVFDSVTAQSVGGFETDHSFAPFAVSGDVALFPLEPRAERDEGGWRDTPRTVRAQSLSSGAVLWERPLRDTRYSGPRPH